jgi:hypothetical protein
MVIKKGKRVAMKGIPIKHRRSNSASPASSRIHARVERHSSGIGTVTPAMVERRAREIAAIDGRSAREVRDEDRATARAELLGNARPLDAEAPEDSINGARRPDGTPGSTGQHTENITPKDDQNTIELVEEGVEEAEHDQMLAARNKRIRVSRHGSTRDKF